MQHAHWRKWLKPEELWDGDVSRDVDEKIQRLNEALSSIHRAFGYRSHRSIRQYIFNYPVTDGATWHHAFADQVEQKILPRFRGIDIGDPAAEQALKKVREIVREVGDAQLDVAIGDSVREHQFVWTGLDRNANAYAGR